MRCDSNHNAVLLARRMEVGLRSAGQAALEYTAQEHLAAVFD